MLSESGWFVGCWRVRKCKYKKGISWKFLDDNNEENDYENDNKNDKWTLPAVGTVPLSGIPSISIDSFHFKYISQFIGKSMISFVPQNSEVGGIDIIINVFKLMGKKLKNTKWLTQVVTVSEEEDSQHWNPILAPGLGLSVVLLWQNIYKL